MKKNIIKKIKLSMLSALFLSSSLYANEVKDIHVNSNQVKSAIAKLIEKVKNMEKEIYSIKSQCNLSSVKKEEHVKNSHNKTNYSKKTYKREALRGSYINYDKEKRFRIDSHGVREYELPALSSKRQHKDYLKKGSYVLADRYTKAGWIHLTSGGWIKGYLTNPKVLQK